MTGLFGGVDLGTTRSRVERALTLELESRRDRWDPPDRHDYYYRGGPDLVLQHGEFRMGRARPSQYDPFVRSGGTCFLDALAACEADPALRYCEGYATHGAGMAILHAWCIAPDDGVVDLTWPCGDGEWTHYLAATTNTGFMAPDTWGYYGVILRPELARWSVETYREAGLLDRTPAELETYPGAVSDLRAEHGHPILKVRYNRERTTL